MAYLIDGNNYIGFTDRAGLNTTDSRARLISSLLKFQSVVKSRVLIVFDGPPDFFMEQHYKNKKTFRVIFPKFNQSADEVIEEIVIQETDLRRFFVVSDDRELRSFARSKGAKLLSCKDFKNRLREVMKNYREKAEMKKTESSLTPLEIKHMTEIFKTKK
ncbi:MAG: NYN domain-containing protein [Candidatus Aminicenantes bacterium]|nr:NYN domain-containing protein [Candidatus Aminicenantes bacterium]